MSISRSLSTALVAVAFLFLTSGGIHAQQPAPPEALQHFNVSQANVQDLVVPATREAPWTFRVWLGNREVTVDLEPNDLRATGFRLRVDDGTAVRTLPTPAAVTWRGSVKGFGDSVAAATVVGSRLEMVVSLGMDQPLWSVQPLQDALPGAVPTAHVSFSSTDTTLQNVQCGLNAAGGLQIGAQPQPDMDQIAEIAIETDLEYYQRYGNNVNNVQMQVMNIMNAVDAIYRRDVMIRYTITDLLVRTSRRYNNTDMRRLLPEFRSRFNSSRSGVQRDVAHLFTGKGNFSGIVGIAYLGVICNLSNSYGVNKAFASSLNTNVGLVAHELGHNWNAPHCDSSPPCNIMCAGLGGCNRDLGSFGPSTINVISAFRNSRSCLTQPNPGVFEVYGQGCEGSVQLSPYCAEVNSGGGTLTNFTGNGEYAYRLDTEGRTLSVTDVEVLTGSATGQMETVTVGIYASSNNVPDATPLAQTTMTVGTGQQFYTATFPSPVTLQPGLFFVSVDHGNGQAYLSNLTSGDFSNAYRRPTFGSGGWAVATNVFFPAVRVNCTTGGRNAIPEISANNLPTVGSIFRLDVAEAAPLSLAVAMLGATDQFWTGGSLPQPLDAFGAPGCSLLVANNLTQGITTTASGTAFVNYPIPSDPNLVGIQVFHQWIVVDRQANRLGLAFSAGGRSTIGG